MNISTTYYVRAFATNSVATVYGAEITFTTITPPPPAVGDNYGGGKIFYIFQPGDPGYVAGQYHGLIAAPSDIPSNAYRIFIGCYGNVGTSAALGTGAANTLTLISSCNDTYNAAKLVDALTDGGYSDWYLPSKDELNKLYLNKNSVGNVAGSFEAGYGLKLTVGGMATSQSYITAIGNYGQYLTQTAYDNGRVKYFGVISYATWFDTNYYKTTGQSCRCIKN